MKQRPDEKKEREDEAIEAFNKEDAPEPPEYGDPSLPEEPSEPEPPQFDQKLAEFFEKGGTIEETTDIGGTPQEGGDDVVAKLQELLDFMRTGLPELVAEAVREALIGE